MVDFRVASRSVAVAIATIRYITRHKKKLLENVNGWGDYFRSRLSQMEFENSAAVNIRGLAISVDLGDEEYAEKVANKCHRAGLLLSTQETRIPLLPPPQHRSQTGGAGARHPGTEHLSGATARPVAAD